MSPKTLLNKALDGKKLNSSEIKIISKHPQCAKLYAQKVLENRFPEGEEAIKTNAFQSYLYAKDVIRSRWKDGEKIISTNAKCSFEYAHNVLLDRFEKGEEIISKDAYYSFEYATKVLRNRFIKGEPIILGSDPITIANYCVCLNTGRWKEAEEIIIKDAVAASRYACHYEFEWSEAEKIILTDANATINYVREVKKQKWPEAEEILSTDSGCSLLYAVFTEEKFEKGEDAIISLIKSGDIYSIRSYITGALSGKRWEKLEDFIENFTGHDEELLAIIQKYAESVDGILPESIHNRMIGFGITTKDWRINQYFRSIEDRVNQEKLGLVDRFSLDQLKEIINFYEKSTSTN